MGILQKTFFVLFLFCVCASSIQAESFMRGVPAPETVSPELRELIVAEPFPLWNIHAKNHEEWKTFAKSFADMVMPGLPALRNRMGVTVTADTMAGVPVFVITPRTLPAQNADHVLLNLHGGGYVLGLPENVRSHKFDVQGDQSRKRTD